ncbi:MAG TPA: DUF2087 domain-containing protein [Burkholderiaceae bacterium]|nr:DUF2087 domain-containing protein [Burkholderiaceae bacterium]
MAREATPLVVQDLSSFARSLGRALAARQATTLEAPTHVELQNLIARAAGYRNLQALKAAPPEPVPAQAALPLSDNARRTLAQFDAEGRLVRWPTKFTVQRMAMWVLWTRFDNKRAYTEREVNAILKAANAFGDHVTLRRELVNHRLLARTSDCAEYRKLPARPDDEVRTMLTSWRSRRAPAVQSPSRTSSGAH